ncbi:hypothetical protein WJX74_004001 [Apatococcus lobatus]|uniref:Deacetylase sirtuin-type domain-containing protein n=2 Tax=Apatococcus TaxID=904362 RepID=A0AAW1S5T0_9CHLO
MKGSAGRKPAGTAGEKVEGPPGPSVPVSSPAPESHTDSNLSHVLHEADDDVESSPSSEELDHDAFAERLFSHLTLEEDQPKQPQALDSLDLAGIAACIKSGKARNIILMCGAGISVSAGIPDFRTPGTGLYDNLQKYNLPDPTAVFEIGFFRKNPHPFYMLAKELYPGNFKPTTAHYFIRLLEKKGLLLRCFTQNIDSLEREAGVSSDKIVAAHGNFDGAHCIDCKGAVATENVKTAVLKAGQPLHCSRCGGLVKPDIVFFGENLPSRFFKRSQEDYPKCDLLIVTGTSLVVHPFAGLIDAVSNETPRVLINREVAGEADARLRKLGFNKGFIFGEDSWRDVLHLGDCDASIRRLCQLLDWEDELDALISPTAGSHKL